MGEPSDSPQTKPKKSKVGGGAFWGDQNADAASNPNKKSYDVDWTGQDTGTPDMPTFLSILDGNKDLQDKYKLKGQPGLEFHGYMDDENSRLNNLPTLNTNPLHALEDFAMGSGDSPWAKAQLEALAQAQGQAQGAAQTQAQGANTAAMDAMAARGGLNTGAMQNLARNSANNATMAGQNIVGQGLAQGAKIRSQDEQDRLNALGNLPGQEVQSLQPALQEQSLWQQAAAQNQAQQQALEQQQQQYRTGVDQYNLTNSVGGLNAQNQFNMTNYQNQIAKQAGEEQATAQANRGKK